MEQRRVEITTPDGAMTTFVHHPTHGGPHPVVLYLMDAPSIRPALHDMASRLASAGYYVLLPFLFYRGSEFREFGTSDEDMHARQELMGTVTPTNIVPDAEALLAFAADDPAAADGPVGAVGFCMSGGLVVSLARAMPERVRAAASIHGAWLVRDSGDSPHRDLERVQAELHFAWCADDPTAPVEDREVLEAPCATPASPTPSTGTTTPCTASPPPAPGTTARHPSCTGSASTRCSAATSAETGSGHGTRPEGCRSVPAARTVRSSGRGCWTRPGGRGRP
jgi:carboxymethylenebutenolidase